MKHTEPNLEQLAVVLAQKWLTELGRLTLRKDVEDGSNKKLRRLFQFIGVDRRALGVPVYKLGDKANENGNVTELDNLGGYVERLQLENRSRISRFDRKG